MLRNSAVRVADESNEPKEEEQSSLNHILRWYKQESNSQWVPRPPVPFLSYQHPRVRSSSNDGGDVSLLREPQSSVDQGSEGAGEEWNSAQR